MRSFWFGLATASLVLTGCTISPPPEYQASRLRFDTPLLGRWEGKATGDEAGAKPKAEDAAERAVAMVITARDVPLKNGRVDSTNQNAKSPSVAAKGYTIIMTSTDSAAAPIEMHGYLFEAGGERLLGMQVSEEQLSKTHLWPFVMPVHIVVRPTVVGDELRLQFPKTIYAWMPFVGWIDAEEGARREIVWKPKDPNAPEGLTKPSEKPPSEPMILLTSDIDRLIEVYEKVMHEPGFWGDTETYKRVKE